MLHLEVVLFHLPALLQLQQDFLSLVCHLVAKPNATISLEIDIKGVDDPFMDKDRGVQGRPHRAQRSPVVPMVMESVSTGARTSLSSPPHPTRSST